MDDFLRSDRDASTERLATSRSGKVTKARRRGRPRLTGPAIGKVAGSRTDFCINMERLMATRMFIQAASGGGKSYALRRLLEQTHGKVQQIVIDPEGELVTLADKFGFLVLAADSQEAPLRPHSADRVADMLQMSGHSAILNLEGFEVEDMQAFVGNFVRGLMNLPKSRWRHMLVVVDEAQLFAPQQDKAESKKPMLDLAARARKRGICPVMATQRISQLHKGVVAHLDNKLVGLTTLENDVERAAEQLGMRTQHAAQVLRALHPGEFLAYGPALTYDVTKVVIGPVLTKHGALGRFTGKPPRKRMTASKLLENLRQLATMKAGGEGDDDRAAIAVMRRWAIAPLLEKTAGRGALADRCRELDLDAQEVGRWLRAFKKRYSTEDLEPKQIRQTMLEQLARLRPMVQGAPLVILG